MRKIRIILYREYITRVRKKSFILMTIIGPILLAALFIVPIWISTLGDDEVKTIAVVDSSRLFLNIIPETEKIKFVYLENTSLMQAEKNIERFNYYAVLFIPHTVLSTPIVTLSSPKQPSIYVKMHIISSLKSQIESYKLIKNDIDPLVLQSIRTDVKVGFVKLNEDGTRELKSTDLQLVLGIIGGILIYFFIFMYASQVMRGVIEEKSNRIVEVIVSSVKPFQLMMGKILGIALVGITQFALWGISTFFLVTILSKILLNDKDLLNKQLTTTSVMQKQINTEVLNEKDINLNEFSAVFDSIRMIDFGIMIGSFLFYFIFGYLMYSALFAAIGGAVDNEADTQQFMLPITIPLILAIVLMSNITKNPDGPIAFWFSIIPFTSSVVMMMRIPFGVPWIEVILSVILLVATFIFTTWIAGKIYKTGILLYGKKVTYKDLYKWIKYKN